MKCLLKPSVPPSLLSLDNSGGKYEASLFIYGTTSIVVKTAELLMLKCNLNIGYAALIIARREVLNTHRHLSLLTREEKKS